MKKVLLGVALLVIAVASVPLWGGCDVKAKVCSGWCEVRHFNQELKAAGCRARCSTERLRCLAQESQDGVDDFIEGFRR